MREALNRLSLTQRWGLVVLAAALVLAAANVWWFMTYREGYPLDIDEAGYTTFGLLDYLSLKYGGVDAWWDTIQAQGTFAPLVPAITSLLVYVHPGEMNGFLVLTGFLVLLVLFVYGIGERIAGPKLGALAALVSATLPGTFVFSREYIYALPTAAFLAAGVFALLRSDGLRRRGWAIACGVALGLMLLSRTMAITYVPGVLAAAVVVAIARGQGDLPRRLLNLVLLVTAGAAVAATWYARNLDTVLDYLTDYGYGSQSQYYGASDSMLSYERLRSVGENMIFEDLYLPLAAAILVGLIALGVALAKMLRPPETRLAVLKEVAAADGLSIALVVAIGYGGLMTSQNGGNGFTLPLAVLLPPLAVLALQRFPRALAPTVAVLAVVAAVNTVSTATVWDFASKTRAVSVPGFQDELPVTKGVPKAVHDIRFQVDGPHANFAADDIAWRNANAEVADMLAELYGPNGEPPIVAFASRSRILNSSVVQLASLFRYQRGMPLIQLEAEPNDSVRTYLDQLNHPELGTATAVVTMDSNEGDYPPLVTPRYAEAASRRLGLQPSEVLTLPDGRKLTLWVKRPD